MDTPLASKADFALNFQREFTRRKAEYEASTGNPYGFRTAARLIAAAHPTPASSIDKDAAHRLSESWRKQLQRCWWGKFMPTPKTRLILAEEMGCSPSLFGVASEDDAEARSMDEALLVQVQKMTRELESLRRAVGRRATKGVAA